MKTSKWCQAVKNKSVFSAHLKVLSDRSGDRSAGGRRFHVAGPSSTADVPPDVICPLFTEWKVLHNSFK